MFFDPSKFKFTSQLEKNWQIIRHELTQLPESKFIPWQETFLYETGWNVFGLYGFGKKYQDNCCLLPETTKIVESIPGMTTAGFSSLKPKAHIQPHVGYHYEYSESNELVTREVLNDTVLRLHLGLIIPEMQDSSDCAIRVVNEIQSWQEGKCLIFDDTVEHEAWNHTDQTRVVLLVDFKK